ncbi:hypothetical protein QQ045_003684 [Rhodiola kirilowii]
MQKQLEKNLHHRKKQLIKLNHQVIAKTATTTYKSSCRMEFPTSINNIPSPKSQNTWDSRQFRLQYGGPMDSTVSCKMIIEKIQESGEVDDTFKLKLMLLFFSSMVDATKLGTSNQRILNGIEGTDDIRALNWCEYIIKCLRDTKDEWEKNE